MHAEIFLSLYQNYAPSEEFLINKSIWWILYCANVIYNLIQIFVLRDLSAVEYISLQNLLCWNLISEGEWNLLQNSRNVKRNTTSCLLPMKTRFLLTFASASSWTTWGKNYVPSFLSQFTFFLSYSLVGLLRYNMLSNLKSGGNGSCFCCYFYLPVIFKKSN